MSKKMSKHTLNERIEAVLDVIEYKKSVSAIAKEYSVDKTPIRSWVHKYKADGVDGSNEFNYHEAFDKYQVSYQQVYSWVHKYQQDGEQGLHDRRGKTLESKQKLTEEEKLQLRIKELEHRNKYLEGKNGLIKKVERGMGLRD